MELLRTRLRPSSSNLPLLVLGFGLVLGLASIVLYAAEGYGRTMLLLWLGGLIALGAYFFRVSGRLPKFERLDLLAPAGLALLFAPLYLAHLYDWPVQVTTDEPTIMDVSDSYATRSGVDPFGYSDYGVRPALLFIVWGKLGHLIGGIDLFHMRLLHALVGLLAIAASYALFRQLLPRRWAFFASCLLGLSHSLLIISRLAMRENTAVLVEVVALALLLWGLRHAHAFATYCGGIAAGLGFYVYHPGRAAFVLWVLFLLALALLYRHRFGLRKLATLGAIAFAGFALMAAPLLISESKAPKVGHEVEPLTQLLITAEGREFQRQWVFADSVWEGYRKNVSFGLTAFNSDAIDRGIIYVNVGHGFVDPLTGVLLWVGVAAVALPFIRRRRRVEQPWPLLMVGGFLALWLSFAFLINQAPKYPRLLITLPFVAYLVTEAVRLGARLIERGVARWDPVRARRAGAALAAGTLAAVGAGNLAIAWDYIDKGRTGGEPLGNTGRYVAAHPDRNLYLIADVSGPYPYFSRGHRDWWLDWTGRFEEGVELRDVVDSASVQSLNPERPFGLLMSIDLWNHVAPELGQKYVGERVRIREITPDGRLVVFEVPART